MTDEELKANLRDKLWAGACGTAVAVGFCLLPMEGYVPIRWRGVRLDCLYGLLLGIVVALVVWAKLERTR